MIHTVAWDSETNISTIRLMEDQWMIVHILQSLNSPSPIKLPSHSTPQPKKLKCNIQEHFNCSQNKTINGTSLPSGFLFLLLLPLCELSFSLLVYHLHPHFFIIFTFCATCPYCIILWLVFAFIFKKKTMWSNLHRLHAEEPQRKINHHPYPFPTHQYKLFWVLHEIGNWNLSVSLWRQLSKWYRNGKWLGICDLSFPFPSKYFRHRGFSKGNSLFCVWRSAAVSLGGQSVASIPASRAHQAAVCIWLQVTSWEGLSLWASAGQKHSVPYDPPLPQSFLLEDFYVMLVKITLII